MSFDEVADDSGSRLTEVRVMVPVDHVAVIDAHAFANGTDRTAVVRQVISEWSKREVHRATLICRVAGVDPAASDAAGQANGKAPRPK